MRIEPSKSTAGTGNCLFRPLIGVGVIAISALWGCCTRQQSTSAQASLVSPSIADGNEETRKISPELQSFFVDAKKSYLAKDLRKAADEFLKAYPNFDGYVPTNLWPAILKGPRGAVNQPIYIFASSFPDGGRGMMIEYAGTRSLLGIYVMSTGRKEIQRDARAITEVLKWDEGIYVYLTVL
jgi:hypothetical protein